MPLEIVQIDAFTDKPFTGNPAAVCILDEPPNESWLRDVAREMNVSETAFLMPHEDGYDLRWFTPTTEVELCGHATLASAHHLWEDGRAKPDEAIHFHTRSGELVARRGEDGWIEMDFPATGAAECAPPETLSRALGAEVVWTGRSRFDLLVEVADEKVVRTIRPDMSLLAGLDARGVIVTSSAISARFDFVSRFFAPRVGVAEDPVTGSAHCTLAPFWSDRLGREDLMGYQVSDRGGVVRTRVRGDRVLLGGQAVTVLRGRLLA